MNKILITALTIIILTLIGGLAYFIYQNQKLISQKSTQNTPSPQITAENAQTILSFTPSPSPTPKLSLKEVQANIEAAVNSKNYAALTTYATNPKVNFSLMSTECCEPQTPDQIVAQMSYIDEGIPMDFNQQSETIKNLKSKNSQLASTFIGISKTQEHLAAFTIDQNNKISAIQLAVSYKLYTQ